MVDSALQTEEYFPDHVIAPGVSGIFRVRPADWPC